MSNYQPHWDLSTVPVDVWASESGEVMTDWHTAKPMNDFEAQLLMQRKLYLMRERVQSRMVRYVWNKYVLPILLEREG